MTAFEEFQKGEYEKIADAHFKTTESISAFFRYYLILMALPLSLVGAFFTLAARSSSPIETLDSLAAGAKLSIGIIFVVIGLVGLLIMVYVTNLRFDALLYARTVNSIRKCFYDRADVGFLQKSRMRTLPQNAFEPGYFEYFFLPVILVFAFFNTLYFFLGAFFILDPSVTFLPGDDILAPPLCVLVAAGIFFTAHLAFYLHGASWRETRYLQRGSIGVDIDGVLNLHRQHFANILKKNGGPEIDPDAITTLPASRAKSLGVKPEDETKVFNSIEYWVDMPADSEAHHYVGALRDMGLDIHIVSNRPWPDLRRLSVPDQRKLKNEWLSAAQKIVSKRPFLECLWLTFTCISLARMSIIEIFTRDWLRRNDIPFDSLTIELGSGRAGVHNTRSTAGRVQLAHKHSLKFFVEDDWEAAHRLAFICDVIFLIRHPYNEVMLTSKDLFGKGPFTEDLPGNVVMVEGWPDIYRAIKQLM